MDCYEIDLKAEFTGILCTMALNMSRHLSVERQNKILLLPELRKVVRNLICCECHSSVEQVRATKFAKQQGQPCCKKSPFYKPKPEANKEKSRDVRKPQEVRKFIPPDRISVKIKNLRHVKPQSSTILTKRRLSSCSKACNEWDKNETFVYRQQKSPVPNQKMKNKVFG